MNTPQDLADAFNNAGLDTPDKLAQFLKPAAISAALAAYDGKLADIRNERTKLQLDLQRREEEIIAARNDKQRELEGDGKE